jgi:hypothetical protein
MLRISPEHCLGIFAGPGSRAGAARPGQPARGSQAGTDQESKNQRVAVNGLLAHSRVSPLEPACGGVSRRNSAPEKNAGTLIRHGGFRVYDW